MKVFLIQPFYRDKKSARNKELTYCLKKNLENKEIEQVVAVVDQPIKIHHPKLTVIRIPQRPTYQQLFSFAGAINPEGINIVCNSDIFYLPEDILKLKKVIWDNRVLALSRWDIKKSGLPVHHANRDSQDSIIFKGKII